MSEAFERGAPPQARPKKPLNEDDFIEVVGLLVGKLKRELVDRIDAKPNFTVDQVIEAVELAFGDMRAEFATEIAALKSEVERLKQTSGGRPK